MASHWFHKSIRKMLQREGTDTIDLDGDTIKIGLSSATHIPNKDDERLDTGGANDFSSGEATGTGYTGGFGGGGRKTLANKAVTDVDANDRSKFDADDPSTWTGYNPTDAADWAMIMKEITSDALSPGILVLDFPSVDPNGNDFTVSFHTDGIGYITV